MRRGKEGKEEKLAEREREGKRRKARRVRYQYKGRRVSLGRAPQPNTIYQYVEREEDLEAQDSNYVEEDWPHRSKPVYRLHTHKYLCVCGERGEGKREQGERTIRST